MRDPSCEFRSGIFISESLHFSNAHYGFTLAFRCVMTNARELCFLQHHALTFFRHDENRYLLCIFPPHHSLIHALEYLS